jgi:hypothetical protein
MKASCCFLIAKPKYSTTRNLDPSSCVSEKTNICPVSSQANPSVVACSRLVLFFPVFLMIPARYSCVVLDWRFVRPVCDQSGEIVSAIALGHRIRGRLVHTAWLHNVAQRLSMQLQCLKKVTCLPLSTGGG